MLLCISFQGNAQNPVLNGSDKTETSDLSLPENPKDTTKQPSTYKVSLDKIDCIVKRRSDSSKYIPKTNIVEMYGNARIEYCDYVLEADQIHYNTKTQVATAFGVKDDHGHMEEYATFSDGTQELQYDKLTFNFKTQKGRVTQLVTKQGEGIVRGEVVKKISKDESFVKGTMYTTCNLERPHYHFTFDKAKIKNKKFAAGKNVNLVIKGIPTPVYFPFAIFPLERGKRAGFTRPSPGYDRQRGFSVRNFGWYQPINDNMDAIATSNFYTSGSWDANASFNYFKKYKHRMALNFNYSKVKSNRVSSVLPGDLSNSFQFNYTFNQDPKVWPMANLNANISLGQSNFKSLNVYNANERLNNNYASSVSFNQRFRKLPVNISGGLRYNQNTSSNSVSLSLPDFTVNTNTLSPFRSKTGKKNIFETLTISHNSSFKNQINTVDSVFFNNPVAEIAKGQYGARHSIPVTWNLKLLKYFNLNTGVNYTEVWNSRTFSRQWDDTLKRVVTDTINNFATARWYTPSAGISTTIYGKKKFNGKIQGIRHVMRPSVSLSYNPDFTKNKNYFQTVQYNEQGDERAFGVFDGSLFGGPPSFSGGSVNFGLGNNIEMKVRSKKDSTGFKKIKIFESLNFSSSYNLKADSLNLQPINISGNTTLFDKYNINVGGTLNPYQIDGLTGLRKNNYLLKEKKRLGDFTNAYFRISGSLNPKARDANKQKNLNQVQLIDNPLYPGEQLLVDNYMGNHVDFNIPWDLNLNYNLSYNKSYAPNYVTNHNVTNSVNGNFKFSLTDNWQVTGSSGYDFVGKKINYSTVNINRDLHCWQMSFNWSPVGQYKRYMFTISPKSSLLRDLKLEKRRTVYDNFNN